MNTFEENSGKIDDVTIIHEIEQQLEISIPEVMGLRNGKTGFKTFHGHIIELSIVSINTQKVLEKIFTLNYLEKLILNETEISEIPENINNLTKLNYLSLKQNSLNSLPENLLNLPSLSYLNLSNNKFQTFVTKEGHLSLLKTLEFENNSITKIIFAENSGYLLENLLLNNNKIEELNVEYLINLRYLSVQYNHLAVLPTVKNLSKLTTLELDFNQITELTIDLENVLNLVIFSISYNKIKDIDFSDIYLKNISYFLFDGNPLDKKSQKRLKNYVKAKGIKTSFFS